MNKKRFLIFFAIVVCIIVAFIFVAIYLNKNNNKEETLVQENVKTYTDDEWKESASDFYLEQTGNLPARVRLFTDGIDVMIIEIYDSEEENAKFVQRYNLDYKTAVGTDIEGNRVELKFN